MIIHVPFHADKARAKAMRAAGHSWTAIARELHRDYTTVRRHLDPEFRTRRNAGIAAARRKREADYPRYSHRVERRPS